MSYNHGYDYESSLDLDCLTTKASLRDFSILTKYELRVAGCPSLVDYSTLNMQVNYRCVVQCYNQRDGSLVTTYNHANKYEDGRDQQFIRYATF